MATSKIDWLMGNDGTKGASWNPVVGCKKVSAGCKNCFAERMAVRLAAMGRPEYQAVVANGRWNGHVTCLPERLDDPLKWKRPRRVFVDSMSDLFHEDVPGEFIDGVFRTMAVAAFHTFIVLTKRPDRMYQYINRVSSSVLGDDVDIAVFDAWRAVHGDYTNDRHWPLPNVWLGVSVEDQKSADERIPWLLKTPAAVRVVSVEPMLGQVDIGMSIATCECCDRWSSRWVQLHGQVTSDMPSYYPITTAKPGIYRAHSNQHGALSVETESGLLGIKPHEFECLPKIDWIIAGCESGPGARPAEIDWFRSLRDQCVSAGVPFFLKQSFENGKLIKMPLLDGRKWEEYPNGK